MIEFDLTDLGHPSRQRPSATDLTAVLAASAFIAAPHAHAHAHAHLHKHAHEVQDAAHAEEAEERAAGSPEGAGSDPQLGRLPRSVTLDSPPKASPSGSNGT